MKIVGIDIGIASIGWAVVKYDEKNSKNSQIIKSGVRIFTQAENPKDGKSLALPRREARSQRRNIKRKRQRLNKIKKLFLKFLNLSNDDLFGENTIYHDKKKKDVWQLRDKALKRVLSDKEFARVLTHIAKRRGYKSLSKVEESSEKDNKKVLTAIKQNKELLKNKNYQTIGQMIYQESKLNKTYKRRNREGDFSNSIERGLLADEVKTIFKTQRELGNEKATKDFEQLFMDIAFFQRDLKSVDEMGKCIFEKNEKRAPKRSVSAEEFVTLTLIINNLSLIDENLSERFLTSDEIKKVLELCKLKETVKYKDIRKALELSEKIYFKNLDYIDKKSGEWDLTKAENIKFDHKFEGFHKLRKAITKVTSKTTWYNLSQEKELLNQVATILTIHKSDEKKQKELKEAFSKTALNKDELERIIDALISKVSFKEFIHLSIKAIENILPYMLEGSKYNFACEKAGYDFKIQSEEKYKLLPPLSKDENKSLTNPVVKRAFAEFRKVLNAIIREYGAIDQLNIEFARDIKRSFKDRKKIEKAQEEYRLLKKKLKERFIEKFDYEPTGKELLKYRLWEEQNGRCVYSGKPIQIQRLTEQGYTEIDHILPFSRSLDDSLNNKVLVMTKENQNKKNRTPYEYIIQDKNEEFWHIYTENIKGLKNIKKAKRDRLLKINFDENSQNYFKDRNKNDTAFIAKFIKNYVENKLEFAQNSKTQKVFTRNGQLTSLLRHMWGIGEKDRNTHLHHAEDAVILAFSTQSEVQKLSTISAKRENFIYETPKDKAKKVHFEAPYESFRKDLKKSIDEIFVSFAPRRKVTGAAHEETIYSNKTFVAKTPSGKLEELKGNSKTHHVKLERGIAKNGDMPRVDIFRHKKTGKFYAVPIYVADFVKDKLPSKAIVAGKNKDGTPKDWLEMDENYQFVYSVYKNDLLEICVKRRGEKEYQTILGYFVSIHSATGNVTLKSHNNKEDHIFKYDKDLSSVVIGIQKAKYIKKYQVSPLGKKTLVKKEKRVGTKRSL